MMPRQRLPLPWSPLFSSWPHCGCAGFHIEDGANGRAVQSVGPLGSARHERQLMSFKLDEKDGSLDRTTWAMVSANGTNPIYREISSGSDGVERG